MYQCGEIGLFVQTNGSVNSADLYDSKETNPSRILSPRQYGKSGIGKPASGNCSLHRKPRLAACGYFRGFDERTKNRKRPSGICGDAQSSSPEEIRHYRFWALDRLTREGTRATLNYLQRLESKGVGYVSYQEQWLDSTGPFKDVMVSMFATLAKQETARISERTLAGLRSARLRGKRLGRPPLPETTILQVLTLNRENDFGARRIAKQTTIPLRTVNAILTRERKKSQLQFASGCVATRRSQCHRFRHRGSLMF
jgi:hypothetical protein